MSDKEQWFPKAHISYNGERSGNVLISERKICHNILVTFEVSLSTTHVIAEWTNMSLTQTHLKLEVKII